MNRRQFATRLSMAAIATTGISGCKKNKNDNQELSRKSGRVDIARPQRVACDVQKADTVCYKARMMTIFMLGVTQKGANGPLMDDFFPENNQEIDPSNNRLTELGIEKEFVSAFITGLKVRSSNSDIRAAFSTLHNMFFQVAAYTGTECPSHSALQNMIDAALSQS